MDSWGCGDDGVGVYGVFAVEVCGDASGFVDDGGDGGDVPEGDIGFDHGVDSTSGEEDEAVAVRESACVL